MTEINLNRVIKTLLPLKTFKLYSREADSENVAILFMSKKYLKKGLFTKLGLQSQSQI
jgi:hypothetical protein